MTDPDADIDALPIDELRIEVRRLRAGIRDHRDHSGHDLCWHRPQLWSLLPDPIPGPIAVPEWPQFLRGCIKYREGLDRDRPDAPRISIEHEDQ